MINTCRQLRDHFERRVVRLKTKLATECERKRRSHKHVNVRRAAADSPTNKQVIREIKFSIANS